MPYRPNIIPKCTRGFLSSITNSLSFLTLRPGAAACSSESMSTGENLAEVGFKILHLCDFEEMVVCNMGGLAFCPSPTSTVVKPKRKLLGKFVSICNLHFSAIPYLTAGVPRSQKYLSSQDLSKSDGREKLRPVPVGDEVQGLWRCCEGRPAGPCSSWEPTRARGMPLGPEGRRFGWNVPIWD